METIASNLIHTLIRTLRKHTVNGTAQLVTLPGKDMYCEILALVSNIVNPKLPHSHKIVSSLGGSYVFGHDDKKPSADERHVCPYLDKDILAYRNILTDQILAMVYQQLFFM